MPLSPKTCLTLTLIMSTALVGCSLLSCQGSSRAPQERSGVTVRIESAGLGSDSRLSASLMRELLSSAEGQSLLQRALMKRHLTSRGASFEATGPSPSWAQLSQAAARLQPEPSEAQLKRLYQRRYPQGQALIGVQLSLKSSAQWSSADWRRAEPSLVYWARTTLSRARQAHLQGTPSETLVDELGLAQLRGSALQAHLSQLRSPHIKGTIKRMRAGELSQVIEHDEGACLYLIEASAELLTKALPHAVSDLRRSLKAQLSASGGDELKRLSHHGELSALCLDLSLQGLKGSAGRSFDQWLRAKVLTLKELGALNQSALDAFSLSAGPLLPEDWPPQLTRVIIDASPSPDPSRPQWHQAEAASQLWLVMLSERRPISYEEALPSLKQLYKRERSVTLNQRLSLEQGWEELSPKLSIESEALGLEELELQELHFDSSEP